MNGEHQEQFESILYLLELYKTSPYKEKCLNFIKNKDIDLNLRWKIFKEMPPDFLKQENYMVHFNVENKLPGGEIGWYDDMYIERYQTVSMVGLIESLEDKLTEPDLYRPEQVWPIDLINEFKEEILQKELSSFVMDW